MPRPAAAAALALVLTLSACAGAGVAADAVTTLAPTTAPSTTMAPTTATTAPPTTAPPTTLPPSDPPNIVLVLMDDLSTHMMEVGFYRSLPGDSTLEALMAAGTTFPNFFNATPLCCPSRASILTGLFPHNHMVYGNKWDKTDGYGGYRRFLREGHEDRAVALALKQAGYSTVFIGKYMNEYRTTRPRRVPRGWDRWMARLGAVAAEGNRYFYPEFNIDGTITDFGIDEPTYLTDLEADMAVGAIEELFPADQPVFMLLSTSAPHPPAVAAPRHEGAHADAGVRTDPPPSCPEDDISDKPHHMRRFRRAFQENDGFGYRGCWSDEYSLHLDQTLALDEMLAAVMEAIDASPDADNTYVVIASDNGRMRGEHAVFTKGVPYEESVRTPMIVVGPGVAAGAVDPSMVLNVDLAPTFLDLGTATWPRRAVADGESMRPLWEGTADSWRTSVLLELLAPLGRGRTPVWRAVRTHDMVYVQYETGEIEIYDLVDDPWQLESLHDDAPGAMLEQFSAVLEAWAACAGTNCQEAARLAVPGS